MLLPVVNATAYADRPTIGLNQGVDGLNNGGERPTGQSVYRQLGFLACANLGLEAFRQTEIQQNSVYVFHIDHVCAVFQVVPHVDLPQACDAVKRGQHFQALQCGVCQCQFGARHLQGSRAFVQRTFTDEVLGDQFLVAFVIGLGNRQFGLGLRHLGHLELVFKLDHHLSFSDPLAIVEEDFLDPATHFRPHHHPLTRAQTAHRLGFVYQSQTFNLGHFHSRGSGWP